MAGKTTRILKDLAVSAGAAGFGYALQKLHERQEKRRIGRGELSRVQVPRRTRQSLGKVDFDERIDR